MNIIIAIFTLNIIYMMASKAHYNTIVNLYNKAESNEINLNSPMSAIWKILYLNKNGIIVLAASVMQLYSTYEAYVQYGFVAAFIAMFIVPLPAAIYQFHLVKKHIEKETKLS